MTDLQTGSNSEQSQDYKSAERSHREVEREVTEKIVYVRGICKDVCSFYVSGHPPSGVPVDRYISNQISPDSALIQSADTFVLTLPAQFHKGYSFPSESLFSESLELCRDLRKCADPSDKQMFLDCIRELKEMGDLIKRGRQNLKSLNPIKFRQALFTHFDKLVELFTGLSNYFSEIENDFTTAESECAKSDQIVYALPQPTCDLLTKTLTQTQKQLRTIEGKVDEVDWYVSDGHERGVLRSDKKLATDVRATMTQIAVEKVENSPQYSLSHRQAARETIAEFAGRPGAFTDREEDSFRKRVDRGCDELGLTA